MKRKLTLTALVLLLTLLLAVTGTFAWLSKVQDAREVYPILSDFEVQGVLSFGNTVYEGTDVLVPVGLLEGSPNYIGAMNYTVQYSGISPAYLRVRVLEQWVSTQSDEILPATFLDYTVSTKSAILSPADPDIPKIPTAGPNSSESALAETGQWVDNRITDYCYYYSVPVQPKNLPDLGSGTPAIGDGAVALTLFDQSAPGTDNAALLEGIDPSVTQLQLRIEVEVVQPNRFREFWLIDAIPQPPAT